MIKLDLDIVYKNKLDYLYQLHMKDIKIIYYK